MCMYKIIANKVTFVGFRGAIGLIAPWITSVSDRLATLVIGQWWANVLDQGPYTKFLTQLRAKDQILKA